MPTIRESTGALLRRMSAGTDGQIDGLINREELKAHARVALLSGLVGFGIFFLTAMQISLPAYVKDSLLAGLLSSLLAGWVAHLKGINTGATLVEIPPGEPAPAAGALVPADAPPAAPPTPPAPEIIPYTDVTGHTWPSYGAYRDRYDPKTLPPEA